MIMNATPGRRSAEKRLTDDQIETLQTVLEQYRQQLIEPSRETSEGGAGRAFDVERDEEMQALANAEIDVELHQHTQREIELIDAALERIALKNYGTCCDCGNAIGFARLQAYPMAIRCIACKRVYEQQQQN